MSGKSVLGVAPSKSKYLVSKGKGHGAKSMAHGVKGEVFSKKQ